MTASATSSRTRKPLTPVAREPERAVSPFGLLRPEEAHA